MSGVQVKISEEFVDVELDGEHEARFRRLGEPEACAVVMAEEGTIFLQGIDANQQSCDAMSIAVEGAAPAAVAMLIWGGEGGLLLRRSSDERCVPYLVIEQET